MLLEGFRFGIGMCLLCFTLRPELGTGALRVGPDVSASSGILGDADARGKMPAERRRGAVAARRRQARQRRLGQARQGRDGLA
jgi:hypothetical protein